jgi:hypothetical protein
LKPLPILVLEFLLQSELEQEEAGEGVEAGVVAVAVLVYFLLLPYT